MCNMIVKWRSFLSEGYQSVPWPAQGTTEEPQRNIWQKCNFIFCHVAHEADVTLVSAPVFWEGIFIPFSPLALAYHMAGSNQRKWELIQYILPVRYMKPAQTTAHSKEHHTPAEHFRRKAVIAVFHIHEPHIHKRTRLLSLPEVPRQFIFIPWPFSRFNLMR